MATHRVKISGVIARGYGVASGTGEASPVPEGTITMQIRCFKERGLDLSAFHPATLNVNIEPRTLFLVRPRYTFRWVDWRPGYRPEDFSFSPCRITFGSREYDAFVYYPHPESKLGHPQPPSLVEVIAPFVQGISAGASVELELNTEEVALLDSPEGVRTSH